MTEMTTHRKAAPRMRKGTISREVEGLVSIGVDVSTFAMILQRVATRRPRRGGGSGGGGERSSHAKASSRRG